MSKKMTFAAVVGSFFIFSPLFVSQTVAEEETETTKPENQRFMKLDANGDGGVTRDEFDAARAKRFAQADADGNGLLTKEEMEAHRETQKKDRMSKRFGALDTDGDGQVSQTEFVNPEIDMFERLDANGDGLLSQEESQRRRFGWRGGKSGE